MLLVVAGAAFEGWLFGLTIVGNLRFRTACWNAPPNNSSSKGTAIRRKRQEGQVESDVLNDCGRQIAGVTV